MTSIKKVAQADTSKNANEGGIQMNKRLPRSSQIRTPLKPATNPVSDWLNQTCCKRIRNQQEPPLSCCLTIQKPSISFDGCNISPTQGSRIQVL